MPELGPADNFKDAWNWMEMRLNQPEPFAAFYYDWGAKCVNDLIQTFRIRDDCLKVLYSGFRQSGKSTELFRLQSELGDNFLPIYMSADDLFERADIELIDVLLGMCLMLVIDAEKAGLAISSHIQSLLESWSDQIIGEVQETRSVQKGASAEVSAGLGSPILSFMARYRTQRSTREEIRRTLEPRTQDVVDVINLISIDCRAELGRAPLLLVDDLDHLNLDKAEDIFVGQSGTLLSVGCDVVYTVPFSLLNAPVMQPERRHFDQVTVLPMVPVRDIHGNPDDGGIDKIRSIVTHRASESLFQADVLTTIAEWSGGVVADALRIARNACLTAHTAEAEGVTPDMVDEAAEDLVLSYKRGLEERYYPMLAAVARSKESDVATEHLDMMHALAILEYENEPTWYDVHPAVRVLLEHKGLIPND